MHLSLCTGGCGCYHWDFQVSLDHGETLKHYSRLQGYKIFSWLVILLSAQSLDKTRNMKNNLKQISMAMMFGIKGLIAIYLGVSPRASKTT
uniref:Uncharacterized protein n=1 Tax=Solanum lycopersicum TaxID=4081 RepID=A0A3Q7EG97_SOLLC